MAYIAPNSTVKILRSISIDNSYRNTILQSDKASQFSMFNDYTKYSLTNYSYQRVNKGAIRVEILADNLYDCNYMLFQNTAYGNKWFYAFITNVNYINDNTSEIEYQIDVMQTWYFDYDLGRCLVVREHTLTDNIGEHLVPENMGSSEMIALDNDYYYIGLSNAFRIVLYYAPNKYIYTFNNGTITKTTVDPQVTPTGQIVNGIYIGARTISFLMENSSDTALEAVALSLGNCINAMLADGTEIIKITQIPTIIWNAATATGSLTATKTINQPTAFYSPDGSHTYTPKNKKLYSSPYQKLVVTNNEGQSSELKWELFSGNNGTTKQAEFQIKGIALPTPVLMSTPLSYRRVNFDYESGLTVTDFPECSWSEDSYAKWWNANKASYNASMNAINVRQGMSTASALLNTGANIAGDIAMGMPPPAAIGKEALNFVFNQAGEMVNSALQAKQLMATKENAQATPDNLCGQINCSMLRWLQNGRYGFHYYAMGITNDNAKAIDDYFSMYGYTVNEVKIPNVKSEGVAHTSLRPFWNYVQTSGCNVLPAGWSSGNPVGLPQDAMNLIAKIYDNGITFWDHLVRVGNYQLNNSPRG